MVYSYRYTCLTTHVISRYWTKVCLWFPLANFPTRSPMLVSGSIWLSEKGLEVAVVLSRTSQTCTIELRSSDLADQSGMHLSNNSSREYSPFSKSRRPHEPYSATRFSPLKWNRANSIFRKEKKWIQDRFYICNTSHSAFLKDMESASMEHDAFSDHQTFAAITVDFSDIGWQLVGSLLLCIRTYVKNRWIG